MSQENIDPGVDRRRFLKAAAATAIAATAMGSGAALLTNTKNQAPAFVPPPVLPEPVKIASDVGETASEMFSRLAEAQAENVRLQAELAITRSQLETAKASATGQDKAVTDVYQGQLDDANAQVEALTGEVSVLTGLVTLYEQLDDVDFRTVVEEGLANVDTTIDNLVEQIPSVTEGLQIGRDALAEFEEQIPLIEDGRDWLAEQINRVGIFYGTVELALGNAVDAAGNFLNMLGDWFQNILKWLPFGIGKPAEEIMEALTDLLAEIPQTLNGLQANIAQPLDLWLEKEGQETQVQRKLIKPVREKALDQSEAVIGQAQTLQSTYKAQLKEPAISAADRQRAIRERITEYRQTYQI